VVMQAIDRGEHIPVPSSIAALFEQSSEPTPTRAAEPRTYRQTVEMREFLELERVGRLAQAQRKREPAKQVVEWREYPEIIERAGHQSQKPRGKKPPTSVMKAWWRRFTDDL
jgi:hypothetical protein